MTTEFVSEIACEICTALQDTQRDELVLRADKWDLVLVDDANYPGFCRVIWRDHVREMSDLSAIERSALMEIVWQVETIVREVMLPHKMNIASLGNVVPHLHWHVIPRYTDDAHFPSPVWAEARREPEASSLAKRSALLPILRGRLIQACFTTTKNGANG